MTDEGSGGQGSPGTEASRPRSRPPSQAPGGTQAAHHRPGRQPSHGGGVPARDRELRAQGRATVKRLLDAGMIEFEERGFHGVRVDDVVRRAGISHGTFYLYFSNKEDLFKALLLDALRDMETIAGDFPVVTRDEAGKTVLRRWVRQFFDVYAAHATVIRILSQADLVPEEVYGDGLQMLFSISEAMTTGMTAASRAAGRQPEHVELTALACLMMLERVNYLLSAEVKLPVDEMANRIADIMFAAFAPAD
jgi:AcrR family transcriptional regulator